MTEKCVSTPRGKAKLTHGFACSRCHKILPSPESGNSHLEKKHNGEGFLTWHHPIKQGERVS